ncbi:predicted protein [Lichtheimia corymbifera JMRC:FSU:9682]|uniref:Uncharacterized protein n=1 Tax=Lichtheimia corymbifera JMRC:FSU:9682 TaxID=1263082 RepID=A0A068SG18_9FUNG|nr:predicted protein [Lichtheimia corymbifera JMRC:FSU:9682]
MGFGAMSMSSHTIPGFEQDIQDEYTHTPDGKPLYGSTTGVFDPKQGKSCPAKGEQPSIQAGSLENYWPNAGRSSQSTTTAVPFSKDVFRETLVEYIIQSATPFLAVKQTALQQLLFLAHKAPNQTSIQLPSPQTLARDLEQVHSKLRDTSAGELKRQELLAFTIDSWTTPSVRSSFLAVTAHWIDERWISQSVTIGFEKIVGAHTGNNMAEIVYGILASYQPTATPFHITMDNAANMDTLATALETKIQNQFIFKATENRVHCIGHIINLATQAALVRIQAEPHDNEEDEELFDNAENNTTRLLSKSQVVSDYLFQPDQCIKLFN